MLKVVLDTNQFVSSLISKKGASSQLLQAWRDHAYILITSKEILDELERVLYYPRIKKKYCLGEELIQSFIHFIESEAIVFPVTKQVSVVKEDPDDDKILACALEAQADYIVSGDQHLLKLDKFEGISIIEVKDFLNVLKRLEL